MPQIQIPYDQPLDTVFALLTDPQAIRTRCEAVGERNVRVEVEDNTGPKVRVDRDIVVDLPSFARRFFDVQNHIRERSIWSADGSARRCTSEMVLGKVGRIDMQTTLRERGRRCDCEVTFSVHGDVPRLIRKRAETFLESMTAAAVRAEHAHYQKVLESQNG